ncbi:MAG: DUF2254 domain-containing protein [Thermoflavifilum sp.]|nr:DUF2254 domain-containing protein [Thermoflavifilum sp.]MCL6513301.1 DUF2254 domain-containing protein [Alicyclobacillus sp.]
MFQRWNGRGWREQAERVCSSWTFHLFLSGAVVTLVFLWAPPLFSGDTDTARNYLNTIVSSLSTILALCISIILVAIQLTASNYTHRVLDFFMRLPYNASLFLVYLVTIIHSFVLMAKIRDPLRDPLPASLRPEMSADLVLVIICFFSLLMYMYAVVQLLKPERIIKLILRDYDRALAHGRWRAALENVEQICDIAKRAASFSDSVTGTRCVRAMLYIASHLPLPADADQALLDVHQSVVDQWVEIVGVAVKERETGLLYSVLSALRDQGRLYIAGGAWAAAVTVIRAYRHLVFAHLLSEGQTFYVEHVADRLLDLAARAVRCGERGEMFAIRTLDVVRSVGERAMRSDPGALSGLAEHLLTSRALAEIWMVASPSSRERVTDIYFQLWKVFAAAAPLSDAARWAQWWRQTMEDPAVLRDGQLLAVQLALHVGRPDVADTLRYVWHEGVRPGAAASLTAGVMARRQLFDGWPAPAGAREPQGSS